MEKDKDKDKEHDLSKPVPVREAIDDPNHPAHNAIKELLMKLKAREIHLS